MFPLPFARPNFYEEVQPILFPRTIHFSCALSLSLVFRPAFFTSVTLSEWKPLTLRMLHFLLHLPRRAPRVFLRLNCLPASLPSSLATNRLPFARRCDLFLSLSLEYFVRASSLACLCDRPRDPAVPNSFHLSFHRFSSRSSRDFSVY